jgi:hypothetical protein
MMGIIYLKLLQQYDYVLCWIKINISIILNLWRPLYDFQQKVSPMY